MAVAKKHIEDLQSNVAEIKELLNEQVGEVADASEDRVITMQAARERLRELGNSTREYLKAGRERAADAQVAATKQVKQRPLLSVAAAFAAGAVISGLIARR